MASRLGDYWRGHLKALSGRYEIIGDIRGRGLLQGIELVRDRDTKQPAFEEGQKIGRACLEKGLLFSLRRGGSVFRFVPPFSTTKQQMDQAAEILDSAFRQVA